MEKIVLKVNGMHCANCEKRAQAALNAIDGVEKSAASARKGEIKLSLSQAVDTKVFAAALEELGFEVVQ